MVQLPTVSSVTLAPETVQVDGVLEENVTVSIEVVVAEIVSGIPLKLCAPGLLKVMVCPLFCTVSVKDCITVPLAFIAVIVSG